VSVTLYTFRVSHFAESEVEDRPTIAFVRRMYADHRRAVTPPPAA
jgi:hypothetical protein